ncbi:MAG: ATP-binding protein [Solirubrobacteraceae bacterium]
MGPTATAGPTALREREREIERVHAVLRAVGQQRGRVLVIEGAAGLGKSRLLEQARAAAPSLGVRALPALASDLEQGYPFGVMRQLFERCLMEADSGERDRWLAGAAALAADVVTAPPTSWSGPPAERTIGDDSYAWQHGLYWLASNLSADAPLVLVVDDLQWCDAPSARALAFIARRLEGQPLALMLATRPLDPALAPEAATLIAGPAVEVVRVSPLTEAAVAALICDRLATEPHPRFVRACVDATGGNPFLVGELLDEAAARAVDPTAVAAADINAIVPHGVANAVLLRLARLTPEAAALARALSVLGECTQVGDAGRLAGLADSDVEVALAALISAGVVQSGTAARFSHPILRSAIYGDLSPAERERMHRATARILRDRGARAGRVGPHVMHTEPTADPEAVALLRDAAREALALGDAEGAAAQLSRALDEPPDRDHREAVLLELGQARARAGSPDAVAPLTEVVEHSEDADVIAAAAIELGGMLFFAGRASEGAAVMRRAQARLPAGASAREQLEVALLGSSYTSLSARREAEAMIAQLRDPGGPARGLLEATTLSTLALDEVTYLRSASKASDLAQRALAAGVQLEPHRGQNWAILALAALGATDRLDVAQRYTDEILAWARRRGAALTVVTVSAMRAVIGWRRGDLIAAQADAQTAIDLAPEMLGAEFVGLAVAAAVLAGLDRDETPDSLRLLIERSGVRYDTEFIPNALLRYASGVLRAAAGDHDAALDELRSCAVDHPAFGGANPSVLPWRSAAALALAELGRGEEARTLAADETRRAQSFGVPRAIGIALRAQALVGPHEERRSVLEAARDVLASSPARLEHARVLIDLGATLRAAGQRTAAREPLLEALAIAARCDAKALERRAKTELAAIVVRRRTTDHTGPGALTHSELRVAELAAAGGSNREIAQTLFVTEKTVETHLGRAFRKLDISSRRRLPDVLIRAGG